MTREQTPQQRRLYDIIFGTEPGAGRNFDIALILLIPKPIRDRLYNFVVRNRIRFFGRGDLCNMPDPAVARRLMQ